MVDRLCPLVFEPQLGRHDIAYFLLVYSWHIGIGNGLADLCTRDYLALGLQELQNSCPDEGGLPCPEALFRAHTRYVAFVLVEPAAHAADQGGRDAMLARNVLLESVLDEMGMADVDEFVRGEITEATLARMTDAGTIPDLDFVLLLCE